MLTWVAVYESGVHATLAGVAIALILPVYPPKRAAVERAEAVTRAFRQSPSAESERLARRQLSGSVAMNERLQVLLRPLIALVVLPLFALANAGVSLSGDALAAAATSRLTWGVIAGLVVGKLVGVLLGAVLAARTPWAELPPGLTHKQLGGGAALAGIGFTISLFIVDLALDDPALQDQARVGVFAASLIAAGLGALVFFLGRADAALSGPPVELLRPVDPERDHIRGPVDAPLTLVEYGDFECPFCSKATGSIAELRHRLGDDLRYVFRHLPLEHVHPHARAAALASEAAAAQDQFWEMAGELFGHQDALEPDDLRAYAVILGLDVERFEEDLRTRRYENRVDDDAIDAEASEVHGTPTFYVNGRRHQGAYDAVTLAAALQASRPTRQDAPTLTSNGAGLGCVVGGSGASETTVGQHRDGPTDGVDLVHVDVDHQQARLGAERVDHLTVGGDDEGVPDPGRGAAVGGEPDRGRVGLVHRRDEAGAVQGAGPDQQLPLLELGRAGAPGGGQADQPGTPVGQGGEQLGEADVVAEGEADGDATDLQHQRLRPRGDGVGLGEAVRVVEVDLVVVGVDPGSDDPERVQDPPVGGRGEHPGRYHESVPGGDLGQPGGPGSVGRLGDLTQRQPEAPHGGLGTEQQLGSLAGGPFGEGGHLVEVDRRVRTCDELGQGYPHGRLLGSGVVCADATTHADASASATSTVS